MSKIKANLVNCAMHLNPWPLHHRQATRPCVVCGRPWYPWPGSYLPCHSQCLFTDEGLEFLFDAPLSQKELAVHLGISLPVVRGALNSKRMTDLVRARRTQ